MRVLAVTSWGGACGIANYAEMLIDAVQQADPGITFIPCPEALDPAQVPPTDAWDALWLNYHRGLHSRWSPAVTDLFDHGRLVITFHDTYGERPPDPLTQSLHDLADAFVVHEPCEGLPNQILIRQGVPAWRGPLQVFGAVSPMAGVREARGITFKEYPTQPVLGTVGFNFPWKNFDRLAEVTAEAGWAYFVASNNATDADEARWKAANPWTYVLRGFQPTATLVGYLAGCDATCFAYECANSGTSGAIRLGLAARKPVIAWGSCRQFRDLWVGNEGEEEPDPRIVWVWNWAQLNTALGSVPIQRVDPAVAYLAHRDSWANHGRKYANIFRSLA